MLIAGYAPRLRGNAAPCPKPVLVTSIVRLVGPSDMSTAATKLSSGSTIYIRYTVPVHVGEFSQQPTLSPVLKNLSEVKVSLKKKPPPFGRRLLMRQLTDLREYVGCSYLSVVNTNQYYYLVCIAISISVVKQIAIGCVKLERIQLSCG